MSVSPTLLGKQILEMSFKINQTGGIIPYRIVILDSSYTPGVGSDAIAPIKYPNTAYAHGERVLGVVMGPVSTLSGTTSAPVDAIPTGRSANVRLEGIAPILSDGSTTINAGDLVVASNGGAGTEGQIETAALTNNTPNASQHIVGKSWVKVSATTGLFALVQIQPWEV